MLAAGLRTRPAGIVQTRSRRFDLAPPRAEHLAGAGGGQDQQFERPGGDTVLLPQLGHEGADLGIGQRRVVLDPAHLARAPAAGFRDGRATAPGCRRGDSRAPPPNRARSRSGRAPGSRFRACRSRSARAPASPAPSSTAAPARRRTPGRRMCPGCWPLGRVLRALPAGAVRRDVRLGALPERHRLGGGQRLVALLGPARARSGRRPRASVARASSARLTRLGEADVAQRAEPHARVRASRACSDRPSSRRRPWSPRDRGRRRPGACPAPSPAP